MTRQMIERLLARGDCDVWLVPHVLAHDLPVEEPTWCRSACGGLSRLRLAPRWFAKRSQVLHSGMDFFGARMHACIAAFSSGVPVVPLAYSRKFNGLFTALEYPHYGDCKAATTEQILDLVFRGWNSAPSSSRRWTAAMRLPISTCAVAKTLSNKR
jgi:hypothetical protein